MKVENMTNNKGKSAPNQFIIRTGTEIVFQSYNSVIVKIDRATNKTYLDSKYWDYSQTTGKYRNIFLGEEKKHTEKKIKEGIYTLTDLN
jgi:hypothetical protein